MPADEDTSKQATFDEKACREKAQVLADGKFISVKAGDVVTIITNRNIERKGEYKGMTSSNAVLIGDSITSWVDIPDVKKYMFSEDTCTNAKKKFIDEYTVAEKDKYNKSLYKKTNVKSSGRNTGLILTTTDGKTYENVSIQKNTPTGLEIIHSKGVGFIDYAVLPEDIQKKYNYDPIVAQKYKYTLWLNTLVKQADEKYTNDGMYIQSTGGSKDSRVQCKACNGAGYHSTTTYPRGPLSATTVKTACGTCSATGLTTETTIVSDNIISPKKDSNLADGYRELAVKVSNGEIKGDNETIIKYANISCALDPDNAYKCNDMLGKAYKEQASEYTTTNIRKAKLYYEKAKRYLPNDKKVKSDLEHVSFKFYLLYPGEYKKDLNR